VAPVLTKKRNLTCLAQQELADLEAAVALGTRGLAEANERLGQAAVDRERVEVALRSAQKLAAVGQLAAGIAHEINTPIQFIGDSLEFLREACVSLTPVMVAHARLCDAVACAGGFEDLVKQVRNSEEAADLAYLAENISPALARVADGAGRVASIVRSLKEFAHPDGPSAIAADLNRALESTLIMARNEYKFVADIDAQFGDLPPVVCHGGDLNQVFLNLIVNAAHAIGDVVAPTGGRGTIRLHTFVEGNDAVITIGDTGSGIPADIQARIFDPFFTTKGVGKGTGQGLAIARAIVVDKHKGTLTFETEPGVGTTFRICVPIAGASSRHLTSAV
jgi:signal transduction histidine kinase